MFRKFRLIYTLVFLCGVFSLSFTALAQEGQPETYFFGAIQDLPVMEGLVEVPEQAVVYDKPGGRIVELVAEMQGVTEKQTRLYYAELLPQLGWQRVDKGAYQRESENLVFTFETVGEEHYVRITLSP